jgi:hypothetical protein
MPTPDDSIAAVATVITAVLREVFIGRFCGMGLRKTFGIGPMRT